ncbi:Ribosomal RNA small subunit methyltransferase E [Alteracholeplasma palmae J233]|uniref:Ribosomal RNA small subunit methyltransferase E n=1 Tax=Alteracholeplasma palmae (strain ATCC 49389 / J233) TaxID=1318466 RepID=U4KKM0_ALTPJ|nr:RsmE family RNA methyltransferase [Alteracholeplasma palmae]CCV64158.1 Ribosomal RNA small subunit methyltransferase E [Alteracholeplasma palmae J233]
MQRYFLTTDTGFITDKNDFHHIAKVMRMKTGDEVILCFNGSCYLSKLEITEDEIKYQKIELLENKKLLNITIIQGLPKGSKTDEVFKTATIFGAKEIIIVPMIRSIAKIKNEDSKLNRYEKIVKEASELAHRNELPKIKFLKSLKEIDFNSFDYVIVADENEKTVQLNEIEITNPNAKIALIIGPEGGIDEKERIYFKTLNASFVSLGEYIMPTELAHLYVLSYFYAKK